MPEPASSDQLALLRGVIASPDDDLPRLVYADWLEEHGDRVQAKYIRGSIQFANMSPDDPERPKWLVWLETALRVGRRPWAAHLGLGRENPGRLYRRGFVHTLDCSDLDDFLVFGVKWFDVAPIEGLRLHNLAGDDDWWTANVGKWEAVCQNPHLERLRQLGLYGMLSFNLSMVDMLLSRPNLRNLRSIDAPGSNWGSDELSLLSDYPHFGSLESINIESVDGSDLERGLRRLLDAPHLGRLRTIYFYTDSQISPILQQRLTERCGSRWGPRPDDDGTPWV